MDSFFPWMFLPLIIGAFAMVQAAKRTEQAQMSPAEREEYERKSKRDTAIGGWIAAGTGIVVVVPLLLIGIWDNISGKLEQASRERTSARELRAWEAERDAVLLLATLRRPTSTIASKAAAMSFTDVCERYEQLRTPDISGNRGMPCSRLVFVFTAMNPTIGTALIDELLQEKEPLVQQALAMNPAINKSHQQKLLTLNGDNIQVRRALALNLGLSNPLQKDVVLWRNEIYRVDLLEALAANPSVEPAVLDWLYKRVRSPIYSERSRLRVDQQIFCNGSAGNKLRQRLTSYYGREKYFDRDDLADCKPVATPRPYRPLTDSDTEGLGTSIAEKVLRDWAIEKQLPCMYYGGGRGEDACYYYFASN